MRLCELARVIRSKNAGPTLLTVDVLFADADGFWRGCAALNADVIAKRYGRAVSDIEVIEVPAALAVKIVMPRAVPAGGLKDRDAYGAQQHAPLLDLSV